MSDRVGAAHALCDCGWRLVGGSAAGVGKLCEDHADANPGHHITLVYGSMTEHIMALAGPLA